MRREESASRASDVQIFFTFGLLRKTRTDFEAERNIFEAFSQALHALLYAVDDSATHEAAEFQM